MGAVPGLARAVLLLLVAGLLVPLGSSPASASLPSRGILYDGVDGSPAPIPERDWFSVDLNHDASTGRLWGSYSLRATPTPATESTFRIWLGNTEGSTCRAFAVIGGSTVQGSPRTSVGPASRSAAVQQRRSDRPGAADRARRLVTRGFDMIASTATVSATCFWFDLASGGDPNAAVYDGSSGRFALLETIDPTTLLSTAEGQRVTKGRWTRVPVTVENTGTIPATGVVVTLRKAAKVTAKRSSILVGTIQPGAEATARFRVKLGGAKSRSVGYEVTADDGVEPESGSFTLAITPKPPKATTSLAGLYLWRSQILSGVTNWDNHGLFFVDKKFAYRGFPGSGLPKCRKVTATQSGDGCVRYWYDARTRTLQVDTERGKTLGPARRPTGVKVGADTFASRLVMPRKGTRLSISLRHQDAYLCPGPGCTTSTTTIAFRKDGSYGIGTRTGTYAIGRNGLLTLSGSDGTRDTSTVWIQTDRKGKAQPGREGVILGDVNYYP